MYNQSIDGCPVGVLHPYPVHSLSIRKSKSKVGTRNIMVRKFERWQNLLEYGEIVHDKAKNIMYMNPETHHDMIQKLENNL